MKFIQCTSSYRTCSSDLTLIFTVSLSVTLGEILNPLLAVFPNYEVVVIKIVPF
jgi:hypothetical protein